MSRDPCTGTAKQLFGHIWFGNLTIEKEKKLKNKVKEMQFFQDIDEEIPVAAKTLFSVFTKWKQKLRTKNWSHLIEKFSKYKLEI